MKKTVNKSFVLLLVLGFQTLVLGQSKTIYAGIEVGAKAIKVTVIDVPDLKNDVYSVVSVSTESALIGKGVSTKGIVLEEDIETAATLVLKNFVEIKAKYSLPEENIFVVISSGVGVAKNVKTLAAAIEKSINKKPEIITQENEAKLLVKGGIPLKRHEDSMVYDIGGGNSKGGFVVKVAGEKGLMFIPLGIEYGTVTLTEKIKKETKNQNDFSEYLVLTSKNKDSVSNKIKLNFANNSLLQRKANIYFSGGTVWSFITLTKNQKGDAYKKFTLQDVKDYHLDLVTNFSKFEQLAAENPEAETVLKTYSQKYLIAGNAILLSVLENLEYLNEKELYFVNNGHLTWLKAYVVEKISGKSSKIY